jgi:peptidoglycan/LPS O-acetylase OafA/YrhL
MKSRDLPERAPAATDLRRFAAFDALRGAMMLLGVYLHSAVAYSERGSWPWKDGSATAVFDISLGLIHVFRMPLFFVMAGFFAALLLERRGAAHFVRNRALRILLPFVAGWLLLFPLVAALATLGASLDTPGAGLSTALRLFTSGEILRRRPDPMHLWFLEYLVMFYALVVVAVPFSRHLGRPGASLDRAFRAVLHSPAAPAILAVGTSPILLFMESGAIDDSSGFVPEPRIFLAYGACFAWGWFLWRNADVLPALRGVRRAGAQLALAVVTGLAGYLLWYMATSAAAPMPLASLLSAVCLACSMWLFIFGFIALSFTWLEREHRWLRYLADSSYWLYLMHMPVLLAFQIALADTGWPPAAKAGVVLVASLATLFATYHVLVRPTWVGALINGRRYPLAQRRAAVSRSRLERGRGALPAHQPSHSSD